MWFSPYHTIRQHIADVTTTTVFSTEDEHQVISMGSPGVGVHCSYPVACHELRHPPIISAEGLKAAGYWPIFEAIPEALYERMSGVQTPCRNNVESVELQAAREGRWRYITTVEGRSDGMHDDLLRALTGALQGTVPELKVMDQLPPKLSDQLPATPWKGFRWPHRDLALWRKHAVDGRDIFIQLDECPPSKSLQVAAKGRVLVKAFR